MSNIKRFLKRAFFGAVIGIINGMLGAGGGMIAVPLLKKSGMSEKQSHANAVAVILPISLLSAVIYMFNQSVKFSDAAPFMLWGVIGSLCGVALLKKISPRFLKIVFGGFMIWAGIRMLMR